MTVVSHPILGDYLYPSDNHMIQVQWWPRFQPWDAAQQERQAGGILPGLSVGLVWTEGKVCLVEMICLVGMVFLVELVPLVGLVCSVY